MAPVVILVLVVVPAVVIASVAADPIVAFAAEDGVVP